MPPPSRPPTNYERSQVLLSKGAKVYIATRSGEKSQTAIEDLKKETGKESIFFLKIDLSDLVSVKAAAEEFIGKESELHALYNNGYALYALSPRSTRLILIQWRVLTS